MPDPGAKPALFSTSFRSAPELTNSTMDPTFGLCKLYRVGSLLTMTKIFLNSL